MSDVSLLELEQVLKRYSDVDEVVKAVDGVSLTIDGGRMYALYGPSGSGKTTLLLLAAGLLMPDDGTVHFEGANLAQMSSSALAAYQRRDVGFVYQTSHLIAGVPAIENAAVKLLADGMALKQARVRASEWLERVGLAHRLGHTPEQLSGGERQRVAIARALVNGPRLVLADEPTGNLDSRRSLEILELLATIAREQGTAVLLATHDPQAAEVADRVLSLRDGRLVEDERSLVGLSSPLSTQAPQD